MYSVSTHMQTSVPRTTRFMFLNIGEAPGPPDLPKSMYTDGVRDIVRKLMLPISNYFLGLCYYTLVKEETLRFCVQLRYRKSEPGQQRKD
jgi:hypothetical protein